METNTTFVRADSVVVLNAVTHVGLNVTLIVHPSHAELVNTVGDAKTFNQIDFVKLWVFVVLFFNCRKYFFHCLMILWFVGEPSLQIF